MDWQNVSGRQHLRHRVNREAKYRYRLKNSDNGNVVDEGILSGLSIPLPVILKSTQGSVNGALDDIVLEMEISASHGPDEKWGKWIRVYMKTGTGTGTYTILGLLREE